MSDRGKKLILWISLITFLISIGAILVSLIFDSNTNDIIGEFGIIFLFISGVAVPCILTPMFRKSKWFLRLSTVSSYLFPLFVFFQYVFIVLTHNELITFFGVLMTSEFMLFGLINIFILKEAGETKSILILLFFIVISFIILRISILQKILPGFDFMFFLFLTISTGCGMLIFGFRCLFELEKNSYLKIISFIACILIAYGSIVFAAKMQSEKVDLLEIVYFIPAFIITLIVLFSLPFSGYINWKPLHKQILRKIMISWVFFLLVFSISFVFPDLFKQIVFKEKKPTYDFQMKDYELMNKNGLETD